MARPIKDTPILKGKAAKRFLKRMREVDEGKHKVSPEVLTRMKENYLKLKSIARFDEDLSF
ncbi:MAG: hypothetical protein E6Q24_08465 [Chitinophagaceae bacterium]|jgi:hypothetical protein|nr:MAG: hypothetical protein E6Q24_08465 [Chitinophagaceae bacterium]